MSLEQRSVYREIRSYATQCIDSFGKPASDVHLVEEIVENVINCVALLACFQTYQEPVFARHSLQSERKERARSAAVLKGHALHLRVGGIKSWIHNPRQREIGELFTPGLGFLNDCIGKPNCLRLV